MEKMITNSTKNLKNIFLITLLAIFLLSCKAIKNLPGADARKYSYDEKERIKKNLEEGRGFRLNTKTLSGMGAGGAFDFASSNSLWRASLDTIDFMPLASANYSGGIIITDWYSSSTSSSEAIKISIRFLTNEIRSDALDIKVFYKKCASNENCKIIEKSENIKKELSKKILTKAAVYEAETKVKNFKPYKGKAGLKDN